MAGSKSSFMTRAFESSGIKPWRKYIDYLLRAKMTGAIDLDRYLDAYRKKPGSTPEELCEASQTQPRVIVGHLAGQLWELAYTEANAMMALNHVAILKTAIKEAKKPKGIRDRENLLRANGALPVPKNQVVHFHQHLSQKTVEETSGALPSFENDMDTLDLPALLPAAPEPEGEK